MINEILVKVSFLKHTLTKQNASIVEGDYNSTKLVFDIEEDTSKTRVLFKLSNPDGEVIFMKELEKNEVMLVGKDANGNDCSLFGNYGLYPFELVWRPSGGKLTSAPGWLNVTQRHVKVEDNTVTHYLPLFDKVAEINHSVFIRYSAYADGSRFTKTWYEGQAYIGIATAATEPLYKEQYTWIFLGMDALADATLSNFNKRILNLEAHLSDDMFITDESSTPVKSVPSGVAPYAALTKIGGMSYTHPFDEGNLFPYPYDEVTGNATEAYGIVHVPDSDDETETTIYTPAFALPEGTYILSVGDMGKITVYLDMMESGKPKATWEDVSNGKVKITVYSGGASFSGIRVIVPDGSPLAIYPMIYPEASPIEWKERGTDEFYHAKVTEIKSKGKNFIDDAILAEIGMTKVGEHEYYSAQNYLYGGKQIFVNTSRISGAFTISGKLKYADVGSTSSGIYARVVYTDGTQVELYPLKETYNQYFNYEATTDANKTVDYIDITYGSSTVSTHIKDLQIEKGATATEYKPFVGTLGTLAIPEAVIEQCEDYGIGLSADCYNYIKYTDDGRVVYVQNCRCVTFDGTENWQRIEEENLFKVEGMPSNLVPVKELGQSSSIMLCNRYTPQFANEHGCAYLTNTAFCFCDETVPHVYGWKATLEYLNGEGNPLTVVYALKRPIITDITHLIAQDGLIEVQSGGTVDFGVEQDVPTIITYQKEG